ncbi:hypothetical protein CHUAL_005257 [Chamberlinius hualienensis]
MIVTAKKIFLAYLLGLGISHAFTYAIGNGHNDYTEWKYGFPSNLFRRDERKPQEFDDNYYSLDLNYPHSLISTEVKMAPFLPAEVNQPLIQARTYPDSTEYNEISSPYDFNYDSTSSAPTSSFGDSTYSAPTSSFGDSSSYSSPSYDYATSSSSSSSSYAQHSSSDEPLTVTLIPSQSSISYDSEPSQYDQYSMYSNHEPSQSYYEEPYIDPYSVSIHSRAFPGYIYSGRPYGTLAELSPAINRYFYTGYRNLPLASTVTTTTSTTTTTTAPPSEVAPTSNETTSRLFYNSPHYQQHPSNNFI